MDSNVPDYEDLDDYYCMMSEKADKYFNSMARKLIKNCKVISMSMSNQQPYDYTDGAFDSDFAFSRIIIQKSRSVVTEYFIFYGLSFVGSVGGTLGLFLGLSFLDVAHLSHIFVKN